MSKILVVATEVQKAVFDQVLSTEIASGFWKNARPADHADAWKDVKITVSKNGAFYGGVAFKAPRNYNFVNPEFFKKNEDRLMEAAKTASPDVTVKQLKKQLIALNQIIGGRVHAEGGNITKLARGRKATDAVAETEATAPAGKNTVRKVQAVFAETPATADAE